MVFAQPEPNEFAFRVIDVPRRTLWAHVNMLMIGPPGTGKSSLAAALSRALDPDARIILCDWETDATDQERTLDRLVSHLEGRRGHVRRALAANQIIILRHIHRLPNSLLSALIGHCRSVQIADAESGGRSTLVFRATCHRKPAGSLRLETALSEFFPCEIHLPTTPGGRADLTRLAVDLVHEFNDLYGRGIKEIASSLIDAISHRSGEMSLHEIRSLIERAYLSSEEPRLTPVRVGKSS